MKKQYDSGLLVSQPIVIDFENPVHTWVFPRNENLLRWFRRYNIQSVSVEQVYFPALFVFSELNCEAHGMGLYVSRNLSALMPIKEYWPTSGKLKAIPMDRRQLQPASEDLISQIAGKSNLLAIDPHVPLESYIEFVGGSEKLSIFFNDSFQLFAAGGDSEEDFKAVCYDLAMHEKSKHAQEIAEVVDRELQQNVAALRRDAQAPDGTAAPEQVEQFQVACKRILSKAINAHILSPTAAESADQRNIDYRQFLLTEMEIMITNLDNYSDELRKFTNSLVLKFGEIEKDANEKAENISSVAVPLSTCHLRVLKIAYAWLPFWKVRYSDNKEIKESILRAYR
jgi:hypothetical protein